MTNRRKNVLPFERRNRPPQMTYKNKDYSNRENEKYMTPSVVNQTLRNYILQDGTVSSDERAMYQDMIKYRGVPDGPPVIKHIQNKQVSQPSSQPSATPPVQAPAPSEIEHELLKTNVSLHEYNIHFDSVYIRSQSEISAGRYEFRFPLINGQITRNGIVSIRFNTFYFPNLNEVTPDIGVDYFFHRRVYLLISNIPSEIAYVPSNIDSGNRFHIEFKVNNVNSTAVELEPMNDTISFPNSLSNIDRFVFRFYVPGIDQNLERIEAPRTIVIGTVTNVNYNTGDNYTDVSINITSGNILNDIWNTNNAPLPSQGIAISAIISPNTPINNNFASILRRRRGHFIQSIDSATDLTFRVLNEDISDDGNANTPDGLMADKILDLVIFKNRILPNVNMITQETGSDVTDYSIPVKKI